MISEADKKLLRELYAVYPCQFCTVCKTGYNPNLVECTTCARWKYFCEYENSINK